MRISIIGSGNVAWHLTQALEAANHTIVEIYSRDKKNAQKLASKLYNAEVKTDLNFSQSRAEVVIIAITDDFIDETVKKASFSSSSIVVHTSGTVGIESLRNKDTSQLGVFYPCQSFSKKRAINFKNIPICIEAANEKTEQTLEKLAFTICENVAFLNAEDRKTLHLAAVFACNFSNFMMIAAQNILQKEGLDFAILHPLIKETFEKAIENGPENSQTGPAIRNDQKTIKKQLELLKSNKEMQKIYELISNQITEMGYLK